MVTGRTDPLSNEKPLSAAAWAADQTGPKAFYNALLNHLLDEIKKQQ